MAVAVSSASRPAGVPCNHHVGWGGGVLFLFSFEAITRHKKRPRASPGSCAHETAPARYEVACGQEVDRRGPGGQALHPRQRLGPGFSKIIPLSPPSSHTRSFPLILFSSTSTSTPTSSRMSSQLRALGLISNNRSSSARRSSSAGGSSSSGTPRYTTAQAKRRRSASSSRRSYHSSSDNENTNPAAADTLEQHAKVRVRLPPCVRRAAIICLLYRFMCLSARRLVSLVDKSSLHALPLRPSIIFLGAPRPPDNVAL